MNNVSTEFRNLLNSDNTKIYSARAVVTLADGTPIPDILTGQIWEGGIQTTEQTSASGSFSIGKAACAELVFKVNNISSEFTVYDFYNAKIIPFVGLQLSSGIEYVKKGVFTVDDPFDSGGYIQMTCMDNMHKLDKQIITLSGSTVGEVAYNAATACGVLLKNLTFDGYNTPVTLPDNITDYTYRQMLEYICQITGNFARCNEDGLIDVKWYDTSTFDAPAGTPVDPTKCHQFSALKSQSIGTDDVVITGIRVTVGKETYQHGSDGYVLEIVDNPFTIGRTNEFAVSLGYKLIGLRFRPLSIETLYNPIVEAGDVAIVTDRKGNKYNTIITSMTSEIAKNLSITGDASTPQKNSYVGNTADTKTLIKTKQYTDQQLSIYDLMVQQLTELITNGFGMFYTRVTDELGGIIFYIHDKPLMNDSTVRWFLSSGGMIEQNKINGTWVTVSGTDKQGNALFNVLIARGLDADWINTGLLKAALIAANTITAEKLKFGTGRNMVMRGYDSFEQIAVGTNIGTGNGTVTIKAISTDYSMDGARSLKIQGTGTDNWVYLGSSGADYHIPITAGKVYIFSAYAYNPSSTTASIDIYTRTNDSAATHYGSSANIKNSDGWYRIIKIFTAPVGATKCLFRLDTNTANLPVYFDCLQLEEVTNINCTAGDWAPSTVTVVDANSLTTGEVKSQNYSPGASGTKINLSDGSIDTKGFKVDAAGNASATSGTIAGWKIAQYGLYNDTLKAGFLTHPNSAIVLYVGNTTYAGMISDIENGTDDHLPYFWVTKTGQLYTDDNAYLNGYLAWHQGNLKIKRGTVDITPSAANTPTKVTVSLSSVGFTSVPNIQVTANSSVPGTQVTGVSYSNLTLTSVDIYLTRTNTNTTTVSYQVVGS